MARILVIDDVEYVRKNIAKALRNQGYTVEEAVNGKEGSDIILQQQIDLLITDIVMPEKSGIEILMDLKDALKNTKIIVITGKISPEADSFKNLAEKFHVAKILYKPFKRQELTDAVAALLG